MNKTFLGKPVPKGSSNQPKLKKQKPHRWEFFLVLPVLFCGGLLAMQKTTLESGVGERSTGGALARTLNYSATPTPTPTPSPVTRAAANRVLADAGGSSVDHGSGTGGTGTTGTGGTGSTGTTNSPSPDPTAVCSPAIVYSAFFNADNQLNSIFPVIPNGVRGLNAAGDPDPTVCSPPYWGREIIYFFIFKALAILNWFAEALAIIMTLYAGILYMTGFYNEGNAKTAKTMLIGIYSGLAIVFLARTIVYSGINLAVKNDPNAVIRSGPPIPGLDTTTGGTSTGSGSTSGSGSSSGGSSSGGSK